MGVDCDICGERQSYRTKRLEMGISVKTHVRPRVYFHPDDDYYRIAFGPFTKEHAAKGILGYYICYDPDFPPQYETIDRPSYEHDVSPFHVTFGILREMICVPCGLTLIHWFKDDGQPTAKLRRHIRRHFWDDPKPEMWFSVDGKDVTATEFWKAARHLHF